MLSTTEYHKNHKRRPRSAVSYLRMSSPLRIEVQRLSPEVAVLFPVGIHEWSREISSSRPVAKQYKAVLMNSKKMTI